jgi:hypothetical protein
MAQHNGSNQRLFGLIVTYALLGSFLAACNGTTPPSPQVSPATVTAAGTCEDPIKLNGSATLDNQTTLKAIDAMSGDSATCVGYKTHGADQVYALTVPGNDKTKLRITVTPVAIPGQVAFDPVVYLAASCSAQPDCFAGADSYGAGSAETVEHVNATGKEESLFIVVDGYDFQVNVGDYKLAVDVTSP